MLFLAWNLVFQSQFNEQMVRYWKQYGSTDKINHANKQSAGLQGKHSKGSFLKENILDFLPAFDGYNLELKFEISDETRNSVSNKASWKLQVSECIGGETIIEKFYLLKMLFRLEIFIELKNVTKQPALNCRWNDVLPGSINYKTKTGEHICFSSKLVGFMILMLCIYNFFFQNPCLKFTFGDPLAHWMFLICYVTSI